MNKENKIETHPQIESKLIVTRGEGGGDTGEKTKKNKGSKNF